MKINLKSSIIGSTIAAMLAFCGTSQAQTSIFLSGWSGASYGLGGWTINNTSAGNFTIGGTMTGAASWEAQFPTVSLSFPGNNITLTGTAAFTGYVGGTGPLRFGLYQDNGNYGTSPNYVGYSYNPPTGASAPGGLGEFVAHFNSSFATTYSSYSLGVPDAYTAGTTNGIGDDTFNFSISLTRLSPTYIRMVTSFQGSTNAILYSIGPTTRNDSNLGPVAANNYYNTVAFYLASNGTSVTSIDFSNMKITYVPEPASMALLGSGLLGLLMVRRFRKK